MSSRIPENDIRDFLAALPGAPFGAADVGIRCGYRRSPLQPNTSEVGVWVDVSEREPAKYYGATTGSYYKADLDVKVVSDVDDLDGGWAKARAVRDALHAASVPTYGLCLNTLLQRVGVNEQNQHIFAANFTLTWSA